jgi:hypothetical protein
MNTTSRRAAVLVAALVVATAPSAAGSPAVPPPPVPWPPPSTHGKFLPYPETVLMSNTYPACGSHIHVGPGDVFDIQYRALVNDEGETVVEFRGDITLDVYRLSDEATLDDVGVSGTWSEIYDPDGQTVTYDRPGPAIVAASGRVEAEAFAEAGLPETFLYLSGGLTETVIYDRAPNELGQQYPQALTAEITENSTAYVFDVCKLLDEAPPDPEPAP